VKIRNFYLACAVAGAMTGLAVVGLWKKAHAQPTVLTPFQTNLTIGTSATLNAVPANPSRKGLIICNGIASANAITVTFGTTTPVDRTTGLVIPGANAVASCFYVLPGNLGGIAGIGAQINIVGQTTSMPVTVLEF